MLLADFIRDKRDVIVAEWETFARTLLPPEQKLSTLVLRDHARGILNAIVADMRAEQTLEEQEAKSKGHGARRRLGGAGGIHAALRIQSGFRLDQLVAEYRALRASVLRLWTSWTENAPGDRDLNDVTRFNEAIDEALTESTTRFMHALERHRDQFVGILGHDLRNPLGTIMLGAATLAEKEGLDDRSARIAAQILASARRMDRMVGDLLDLTRARLGDGVPVVRTPQDLGVVVRQVLAELRGAHPDVLLHFESKGELGGDWDGDRLAQVVSNLVGNALQHGSKERPVTVVARGRSNEVVLEVHNEGPPIPASVIGSIFEPMTRFAPAEGERRPTHLGLGLYIAERIVSAHGGRIEVTSTKATGTTFAVHLPRHLLEARSEAVREAAREPRRGPARRRRRAPPAAPRAAQGSRVRAPVGAGGAPRARARRVA